jgi:hypothetical protein
VLPADALPGAGIWLPRNLTGAIAQAGPGQAAEAGDAYGDNCRDSDKATSPHSRTSLDSGTFDGGPAPDDSSVHSGWSHDASGMRLVTHHNCKIAAKRGGSAADLGLVVPLEGQ